MVTTVHIHAAYTFTVKGFRQLITYLPAAVTVNNIEPLIRTYIIAALPEDNGIYNSSLHAYCPVYVLEG